MSKNKLELDCTRQCQSHRHGQLLTSVITKRSLTDKALASFIKCTCANFCKVYDPEGRTALHMSASRGRLTLMEWLVRHSTEAFINAKDRESGYTPLHRSIFYGQINAAVLLLKIGVNTDIVDKDDYKALEHAILDRQYMYKHVDTGESDVYVWGCNANDTLGTATPTQRITPELLGFFSRNNTKVKQVCLGKFHSVWVCSGASEGEVYACGQLVRAGGPRSIALQPVPLKLPEPCVQVAIMLNATVFLLESGCVVQYSLDNSNNRSHVGKKIPSVIRLPSVKPILKLSQPLGICAGSSHAVVWNVRALYTWGVNVGQLGHLQEDKVVLAPKRVAISVNNREDTSLQLACASDAATVFTTSRGDVYLLHKYICKKIAVKQINLRQVCVQGRVTEQGVYSNVTVLLLTNVGQLLVWQDTANKITRCVFGLSHQTVITHIALTQHPVFFTTKYGEVFFGFLPRKAPTAQPQPIRKEKERDSNKSALVKFLEKDDCTSVDIVKIPNIHRAVSIAADVQGMNFACLQIKPTCGLRSLPVLSPSSMSKHMEALMESGSEDDLLHDVIFKVGSKQFPAHIYIVATRSELLYRLYQEQRKKSGEKPTVPLENVHPDVFQRILRYMYTGTCDVTELGPCQLKLKKEDLPVVKKGKEVLDDTELIENSSEISAFEVYKQGSKKGRTRRLSEAPKHTHCDPVKLLQAAAKKFQVMALHKLLDKFYYRDGIIHLKDSANDSRNPSHMWDREALSELVDTCVVSKDGVPIPAHKCVLAARLDYFHGMFMHSWTESKLMSKVTLPINHGILLPVINFLYTDTCPEVENSDSIDFICSMLIVADQLFVTRLREMCEIYLAKLITLKNCAELCQLAHTYNATQLKQYCMEFISLNLSNVLENKSLTIVEESLLDDITEYYCKFNPIMSSRIITPFDNAPSDEIIEEFAMNYSINLDYTDEEVKKDDSTVEVNKKKNKQLKKLDYTENEKARMRYESVSLTSHDLTNEIPGDITLSLSKISKEIEKNASNKKEKWIEVPKAQDKLQKVNHRHKPIMVRDVLNDSQTEQFTKLVSNNFLDSPRSSSVENSFASTSRMSVSPKESSFPELVRSPQSNFFISHVGPKLSQKQRKKMAEQGEASVQNLNDYMTNKINIGSPPEKPRNPWKICEPPAAASSPNKEISMEFDKILSAQKKQKEDHCRIMTKPLVLTQLEDKAIEELERFYNIHEIDDELITVQRIELQVSSPQWIHTAQKC
ncbi:hypothetical protein ACJJTC_014635 [Scirpophaga incertulas]